MILVCVDMSLMLTIFTYVSVRKSNVCMDVCMYVFYQLVRGFKQASGRQYNNY